MVTLSVAALVAACGTTSAGSLGGGGGTGGSGATTPTASAVAATPEFTQRAEEVEQAWATSSLSGPWTTGLVTLQDLTIPPENGFPNDATKEAFSMGAFRTSGSDPVKGGATPAQVEFADGSTMDVTRISAQAAFESMRKFDPGCERRPMDDTSPTTEPGPEAPGTDRTAGGSEPGAPADAFPTATLADPGAGGPDSGVTSTVLPCLYLTVTGAKPVTVQIRTSRGIATVPAWRFSIKETGGTVDRVALADSAFTPMPEIEAPAGDIPEGMVSAQMLDAAQGSTLTFTLGVGACDTDVRGMVHETDTTVVVGGTSRLQDGVQACTDQLVLLPVTVDLKRPLGDRVVLDVVSGRPLVLGRRF